MQDLDEFTVTDEALRQMAGTENPRLKEIAEAAVRHLHAFAREVESDSAGVAAGDPVHDSGWAGLHVVAPGGYSAVGCAGPQCGGQCAA